MKKVKVTSQKSKKSLDLAEFLDQRRVEKGNEHTHTCMGKPFMGSFYIPDEEMNLFFKLYEKDYLYGKKLCLIEKHKDVGPMVIDLDLKFEPEYHTDDNGDEILNENNEKNVKLERKYTEDHIKKVVQLYMDEIEKSFMVEKDQDKKIALVFERNSPYLYKGEIKDGIHIMFPYIISEPNIQYLIRENVIKKANEMDIFQDLPLKKKIMTEVFDRSVIQKNGWFMYGSSKPYCETYQLTHIYDSQLSPLKTDELDFQGINNLAKFLSIRRYHRKDSTQMRSDIQDGIDKILKKQKTYTKNKLAKIGPSNTNYDTKTITQLVNILSNDRADSYEHWMEVGWCLHNIDHSNIDLLNIWIEFSKRSKKFKEGRCENEWMRFRNEGFGLGSLHHWAKLDNYEGYMEIKRVDIQFWIEKSINQTNYDIAKVLHAMFRGQFVCCSYKNNVWYEFKDHRWQEIDSGIELRKKISNELVDEYCRLIAKYNILASMNEDEMEEDNKFTEDDQEEFLEKSKILHKITNSIKTTSFKDNILKECKELFYEKGFVNKLDSDPYLIGFENGVFDLKNYEFRDGRPEDYISFTTGNNYIEFDDDDPYLTSVRTFFSQLFPQMDLREYMWDVYASCLQGVNMEEKFRVFTGVGANGKSKLNELMQFAYGDYCNKFPITLLTQKRAKSNAVSPEVIQGKGKRYGYFEEPDDNERINAGLMKEYSGNDMVKGRGLFKEPVEFKPQWKLFLLCNEMPELPAHDGGTWRRVDAVEYPSKFVYNPKKPNEFPRDDNLSEKLKDWKEAFMYLLIKRYLKYKKNGIITPECVQVFTKNYAQENDKYYEFIFKYLEETHNNEDVLDMDDVHEEFKYWHSNSCSGNKTPSKRDLKKYLEKALGRLNVTMTSIKGYRFTNTESNVKDPYKDEEDDLEAEADAGSFFSSSKSTNMNNSNNVETQVKKIKIK